MGAKISVIIPMYNSQKTIGKCLKALYNNSYKDFECIVVDDCSTDNSVKTAKEFPCKIIKLKKNSGPAKARNTGAEHSKGEILFFLDSDVLLLKNALDEIIRAFKKNKEIAGMIGIYDKEPANKTFFAQYMALRKFSDFMDSKRKYFTHFAGACTAVKKNIFWEFNGFDTKYKGADTEDYEMGYRITNKYKILFNPNLRGKHFFPTFTSCLKNYFKRSSMWFQLFKKRKKFDAGAATPKRGMSSLAAFFALFFALLSMIFIAFSTSFFILFIMLSFICLIIFLITNLNFYKLTLKEKGVIFTLASVAVNFVLFISVTLGVFHSIAKSFILKANNYRTFVCFS